MSNRWRYRVSLLVSIFILTVAIESLDAQTLTVLHAFTGHGDGWQPYAGLTTDAAGNLYGTTYTGGYTGGACSGGGCGLVFKLQRGGSGWILSVLHAFQAGADGALPRARVILGPDGGLYGTTESGGNQYCPSDSNIPGCGIVFRLQPGATVCEAVNCPWTETILHTFGGADGMLPSAEVAFDQLGNLYGTTFNGGLADCSAGCGTIYEISPSNGGWAETVLYAFSGGNDGAYPQSGLIFDSSGNLYGTASAGGNQSCQIPYPGCGTAFELSPSGPGWTLSVLYDFQGSDGAFPRYGLTIDSLGNLYGATAQGGATGGGNIFELTPSAGNWTFRDLYDFTSAGGPDQGSLAMDTTGSLYGTTLGPNGTVFELSPSGDVWTYSALHNFTSGEDGSTPYGNVIFDRNGNLYGTASRGGQYFDGVVWEITP